MFQSQRTVSHNPTSLFVCLKIPINKSKHHAKLHDQNQRNTYNTCHRIKIKSKKKKKEYNLNSTQVYKTIHHIPKNMPRRKPSLKFKVVLLGEGRVGKTSILIRFCQNTFNDRQQPTLQASYLDRKVTIDGQSVSLSVWDTAGQERFHALGPIYYRDADAALCVYDITDGDSLDRVKKWVQELKNHASDNIVIAIAGNKIDLEKRRHVKKSDALALAKSVGAEHFDTSAKLNKGLQEAFLHLAKGLIKSKKNESAGGGLDNTTGTGRGRGGRNRQSRVLRIREDSDDMSANGASGTGKKKGGCC